MTQEADSNETTVDESVEYDAVFDVANNRPIEAVFEITPLIADLNYTHYQEVPSATWEICHKLGKCPSVVVTDSAGTVVMGDTEYVDKNNVKVYFNAPFSGRAYLN